MPGGPWSPHAIVSDVVGDRCNDAQKDFDKFFSGKIVSYLDVYYYNQLMAWRLCCVRHAKLWLNNARCGEETVAVAETASLGLRGSIGSLTTGFQGLLSDEPLPISNNSLLCITQLQEQAKNSWKWFKWKMTSTNSLLTNRTFHQFW